MQSAEVERGEELGFGCGESRGGDLEPGGSRRVAMGFFGGFAFSLLKLEEITTCLSAHRNDSVKKGEVLVGEGVVSGARTSKPVSRPPNSAPWFRPESAVGQWGSWVLFLIHRMAPQRPVVALGAVLGEAR